MNTSETAGVAVGDRGPIPAPLVDVLVALRWWYWFQIALASAMTVLTATLFATSPRPHAWIWALVAVAAGFVLGVLPPIISSRLLVPKHPPEFLVLRSFKTDAASVELKFLLESLLGGNYRLAGIRSPRRRPPLLLKPVLLPVIGMNYTDPRHMGLEAGDDWQARLWRSIGNAYGVFMDLRDLTEFVHFELRLCFQGIGLGRMAFIVDESRTLEAWRGLLAESLGVDPAELADATFLVWTPDAVDGDSPFSRGVRAFAARAGTSRRFLPWAAYPLIRDAAVQASKRERRNKIGTVLVFVLGVALAWGIGFVLDPLIGTTWSMRVQYALVALSTLLYLVAGFRLFRRMGLQKRVASKVDPYVARQLGRRRRIFFWGNLLPVTVGVGLFFLALVGTAVATRMLDRGRMTMSMNNMRTILLHMQSDSMRGRGWPPYNGKSFVLAPVATRAIDVQYTSDLRVFFSPGDTERGLDYDTVDAFRKLTPQALKRGGSFSRLTSYAGRRNAEREYRVTPDGERAQNGAAILADVSFPGFVIVGYTSGALKIWTYEELGIPEDWDMKHNGILGDDAPPGSAEFLKTLSLE